MGERVTVEGTVENVIFHNEENGYTVLLLTVEGEEEPVTVVGCIPCAAAGEGMTVTGVWSVHPVHGRQLTAESVERRMPEREEDMIAYLSSGILKGVGPATAQRLVERFGADTLLVIEQEPERLRCIKGITAQRAKELSDAFRALTGLRQLMEFLARYDLPVYLAMPLQRTYGDEAIQALRDDPYILSRAQYGVDFSIADEIAISLGFDGDDPCRLRAALTYELEHNAANGHVFLPREKLLFATSQLLAVTPDELELALDKLIEGFGVVEKTIAGVQGCYLPRLYQAETFVAERLLSLVRTPVEVLPRAEKVIDDIEKEQGVAYAPLQRQAVCLAAQGGILLLTGGPGTGKTMLQKALLGIYSRNHPSKEIVCCAPTGRAARRMEQSTGFPASTVHKALGLIAGEDGEYGDPETLDADLILVDEVSMLDIYLAGDLFDSVKPGSQLILIGDADQLPSVGPGAVLSEMIASGTVPVVKLDKIFRQTAGSRIATNAKLIRHGNMSLEYGSDFQFYDSASIPKSAEKIVELYLQETAKYGVDNVALLSPYRQKTETGVNALNELLREKINPPAPDKAEVVHGTRRFRCGDKVMQIKNCDEISNGDIGYITKICKAGDETTVTIDFGDGRTAEYDTSQLDMLDLGYASTIHKSQGSEYRSVIINLQCAHYVMLTRPLVYTAITRGKENVIIVGERRALCMAIKKTDTEKRGTCLAKRLQAAMQ